MKFSRRRMMGVALIASLALSACQATYRNHGYVPPEEDLAQVVVGRTTQPEVESLIGRPSAQGLLTGSGWYYVGSRWQFYGPREPREVQRQVVAISFNENGTVTNVERFGQERGRVVVLSRRVTDTGVTSLGLIRQLLGNIGRVSAGQLLDD
ncbi:MULTISPECIES: outer membrane protein assembly factor BamE [unclassified Paracoccus (in: a-proteobacteria)]|uniref:outer membrane protein assembly factor BamE n=1 Tax=unclassified Paracoccus (in: a-proteobacteria) TaxID=2688777 RepID=UPI0012B2C3C4|nr:MULTISPECIES: outer membrane protein assembly factor BamE [unclassified Paracoccus (in: a-proteobacteria)]UXU73997.1 outer membrane protein assembly factor BamE [Paracoccus sp. SMMA_5]UXU79885.1 outer membrane protein assembly factor BamE [Paracoccus sp. SMMA_5_TC]